MITLGDRTRVFMLSADLFSLRVNIVREISFFSTRSSSGGRNDVRTRDDAHTSPRVILPSVRGRVRTIASSLRAPLPLPPGGAAAAAS